MTISKDLFLSILAMDAYNRGYDAGIADGGEGDPDGLGESGQIGGARIINPLSYGRDETAFGKWRAADFYAVAYDIDPSQIADWGNDDTTVISYRGTASDTDWFEGWTIVAGMVGWNTSKLALDSYIAVPGQSSCRDEASERLLSGHSLGRHVA